MTKLELMMMNNELEARVIELEAVHEDDVETIAELRAELKEAEDNARSWRYQYEDLEQEIEREAAERPAIPYAEWYSMLHPTPGSNPDLAVLARTKNTRIIA